MAQTRLSGDALIRAPDGRLFRLDSETRTSTLVEESRETNLSWGPARRSHPASADDGATTRHMDAESSTFHIDPGADAKASIFHIDPGVDAEASTFHIDPGVDAGASTFHIDPGN